MGSSSLNKTSKLIDEFGRQEKMLGDNIYQGAPVTIDVAHHEIHCGDSFIASRVVDLANGASDILIIKVPNETGTNGVDQKNYHTVIHVTSESEVQFDVYEGVETVSDGTAITFYNRDRNSTLITGLQLFHTPTTATGGTNVQTKHWGAGKQSGGDSRGEQEIILKNNTKYRLVITNTTTSANHISWEINHYIHPGI